ncbi:MAG: hypothetical protein EOP10_25605, partial [Proteobacteria bacterium]
MSIKGIFGSVFAALFLLLVCVVAIAMCLVYSQEQLSNKHLHQAENLRLIQEMRDSREYLTQFARGYLRSSNDRYMDLYESVLDIWEGRKPRAVNLEEVYWDILADTAAHRIK